MPIRNILMTRAVFAITPTNSVKWSLADGLMLSHMTGTDAAFATAVPEISSYIFGNEKLYTVLYIKMIIHLVCSLL